MSAEFILSFEDKHWYATHLEEVTQTITGLDTFTGSFEPNELRLTGTEPRGPDDWSFDVRLFLEKERIFLEISAHPKSIERDLSILFEWIRSHTRILITDEDGELSDW
ncbi:3-hydroxydecyl-ACP dehydratase [Pseudomonas citri]|uniref:3-hydroxydecyl-ACP dehydratase n=1 Tax=Pseudomonas citri TaxID=2978349 RepID=UPI0021B52C51|nr:3-hydroxydecyl-ACP dehydratase [Pseudomonas citri]